MQKALPLALVLGWLLATSPELSAREPQNAGKETGSASTIDTPQEPLEFDPQRIINPLIDNTLGAVNECYRGLHPYFNHDIIGEYLLEPAYNMVRDAIAPKGICERYLKSIDEGSPFEVNIPTTIPFVTINVEKYCKSAQQHPGCLR